jgi:cyclic-di-GMP-binding protein
MPSFDIVSELDHHELTNAVDQASRVITTRFDFKGVKASFKLSKNEVNLNAENEMQINQMTELLAQSMAKRGLDVRSLDIGDIQSTISDCRLLATIKEGLEQDLAKKLIKLIKAEKIKVQTQIQGEQLRVTGKKRDDLQQVIALMKKHEQDQPLQFTNFRD